MKKVFICLLLALFSMGLYADPIDCMTQTEAESLAKHLRTVGFVYEYCDCCQDQSVILLSITEVKVEACSYDAERWEVKVKGEKVHVFGGTDNKSLIQPNDGYREEYEFVASLNYTYVFSAEAKAAIPLGFACKTWTDKACIGILNIPAPKDYNIEDKEYIKWYKKNVE